MSELYPKNPRTPRQVTFDRLTRVAFVVSISIAIVVLFWLGPANAMARLMRAL